MNKSFLYQSGYLEKIQVEGKHCLLQNTKLLIIPAKFETSRWFRRSSIRKVGTLDNGKLWIPNDGLGNLILSEEFQPDLDLINNAYNSENFLYKMKISTPIQQVLDNYSGERRLFLGDRIYVPHKFGVIDCVGEIEDFSLAVFGNFVYSCREYYKNSSLVSKPPRLAIKMSKGGRAKTL